MAWWVSWSFNAQRAQRLPALYAFIFRRYEKWFAYCANIIATLGDYTFEQ
jgi:hypothetical protein